MRDGINKEKNDNVKIIILEINLYEWNDYEENEHEIYDLYFNNYFIQRWPYLWINAIFYEMILYFYQSIWSIIATSYWIIEICRVKVLVWWANFNLETFTDVFLLFFPKIFQSHFKTLDIML